MYDVIIVGGGPAGCAAAVYTARKKLKTLLITESFGGQSIVSNDIHNWIGETNISGFDLAKKFEQHVRNYTDVIDIKTPEKVVVVKTTKCSENRICDFQVTTGSGSSYDGKVVIVTSGARRRKLGIPGEEQFNGKGVAYCSTCDAPIFQGKKVAVVGGGNAGLEAVVDLFPYAEKIYLLVRGDALKGDQIVQEDIKKNPKAEVMFGVEPVEIVGDKFVDGVQYKDTKTGEEKKLDIEGIFIEIGSVPNSELVKGLVAIDQFGQIATNSKHSSTSHPGIFAAGDVTDDPYKQNNISAGDGVRAALAAYAYILQREKQSPASEPQH